MDETRTALGGSNIGVNGGAPAVLLDGGAVIGALGEDADEDGRDLAGYGFYAGGVIGSNTSVILSGATPSCCSWSPIERLIAM